MDASQQIQPPLASTVSATGWEDAIPTYPAHPAAGLRVGSVNKSIIADSVQNAQGVNFGS